MRVPCCISSIYMDEHQNFEELCSCILKHYPHIKRSTDGPFSHYGTFLLTILNWVVFVLGPSLSKVIEGCECHTVDFPSAMNHT